MYRAGTFPACHSARRGSCSVHCVHRTRCNNVTCFVLSLEQMTAREFSFDIDRCVSSRLSVCRCGIEEVDFRLQPPSRAELRFIYAASSANSLPTFRDTYRLHLAGSRIFTRDYGRDRSFRNVSKELPNARCVSVRKIAVLKHADTDESRDRVALVLGGSDWETLRAPALALRKKSGTYRIGGWVGPKTGLEVLENRTLPCPCRHSNLSSFSW